MRSAPDGLVIDLSAHRSVQIDPKEKVAWVSGGALLADFDHEAQALGLATPLGINSTTGVAGLTLGGGFGWLTRQYGMTVDNLLGCEVVTADGQRRWASATEEPDLFWALRGGGGNFGVVTLFQFKLHDVGPMVTTGLLVFPAAEGKSVLRQYRTFAENAMPEDLNVWVVLRKAPPLPFLPASAHGSDVVILAVFYNGDPDKADAAIAPLRQFGQTVGEHVGPAPYAAWQQAFDPLLGPGARNYWKSHNFSRLDDAAIDAMTDFALRLPSPLADIFIGQVGGVANRVAPDATAYAHRDARYVMNVHARWERNDEDAACIAWARRLLPRHRAVRHGQRLRELPDRGGNRARGRRLWAELRPAGAHQAPVRSAQPVLHEPEHRPGTVSRRWPPVADTFRHTSPDHALL